MLQSNSSWFMSSRGIAGALRVNLETMLDRNACLRAGEVAELGKCLLCKNAD